MWPRIRDICAPSHKLFVDIADHSLALPRRVAAPQTVDASRGQKRSRRGVIMSRYSEHFVYSLIDEVKEHECIWNVEHEGYNHKTNTTRTWKDIATKLQLPGLFEVLIYRIHCYGVASVKVSV